MNVGAEQQTGFPRTLPTRPPGGMAYVLTRDGVEPLGFADGHGTWVSWLHPRS